MANLADKAVVQIHKQLRRVSGVQITYARGAASLVLTAIPGRSGHTLTIGEIATEYRARDYLILASELIIGGVETMPARGDTITEGGVTYDALSLAGEPPWEYTDQTRQVIRVHVKL